MPDTPSLAQSEASRCNGARSHGPTTPAGKARAALNSVRHGLSGQTFFLLPDEDPAEFLAHETVWLEAWSPRDLHEHAAAAAAIRAMWREIRADRLEAQVLTDLFGASKIEDEAERVLAKLAAMKALGTLLRYRSRIERDHRSAMEALTSLRQRRVARSPAQPSEPEKPVGPHAIAAPARTVAAPPTSATIAKPAVAPAPVRSEPEPTPALNRHQRRALASMSRRAA